MSYRVVFLAEAKLDVENIEEYLSQFYDSTVRNFFEELKKKVATLEYTPFLYSIYDGDPFFRRIVAKDYLLFYSIDDKQNLVVIHRILHSKRDISWQILR